MPLRHDARRGALMMLGATAGFALMGALVKEVSGRTPFAEIMFFRNFFAMPIVLLAGLRAHATLRTTRFPGHLTRACTGLLSMGCGFFSLALLPLAEQTALNYAQPLFVILLAIPILGERPGAARWAAVLLGFLGVLVIAAGGRGGAESGLLIGYVVAVAGGLFGGITTMLVRQLSATEASATIVLWQCILMSTATALVLPFVWVTPGWGDLALLIGIGLIGGVSQVLLTEAYASAQVSSLGPYSYTGLIWAGLLGWMVFGDVPGWAMMAGSALIVGSGFIVLHSELRKRRRS